MLQRDSHTPEVRTEPAASAAAASHRARRRWRWFAGFLVALGVGFALARSLPRAAPENPPPARTSLSGETAGPASAPPAARAPGAVAPPALPLRLADQSKDMVGLLHVGDDVRSVPVSRSLRWQPPTSAGALEVAAEEVAGAPASRK